MKQSENHSYILPYTAFTLDSTLAQDAIARHQQDFEKNYILSWDIYSLSGEKGVVNPTFYFLHIFFS